MTNRIRFSRGFSIRCLTVMLAALMALLTPLQSYAIPIAGSYAFTSGLTGAFTSNGTSLTSWAITDTFGNSFTFGTPSQVVLQNNPGLFAIQIPPVVNVEPNSFILEIPWDPAQEAQAPFRNTHILLGVGSLAVVNGTATWNPVVATPEPSTSILMIVGLLLMLGYGWWQRQRGPALSIHPNTFPCSVSTSIVASSRQIASS